MDISVVVPVYGCPSALSGLHRRVTETLEKMGKSFELVLVNDACPQDSWKEIEDLCAQDSRVIGVNLSRNFGQTRAITAGLDISQGDWVVVMDCDLQDPPECIPELYEKAQQGYDVVFARRIHRKDGAVTKFLSRMFYKVYEYFTDSTYDGSICNFSISRRIVIDNFCRLREFNRDYSVFIKWLGFKQATIDIEGEERYEGKSSYSFRRKMHLAGEIITAQSDKPLQLSINIGFIIAGLAFLYLLYTVINYFFFGPTPMGYTSTVASIYLMGGLTLIAIGVVGKYVGNIFTEVKGRPLYIISETLNAQPPSFVRGEVIKNTQSTTDNATVNSTESNASENVEVAANAEATETAEITETTNVAETPESIDTLKPEVSDEDETIAEAEEPTEAPIAETEAAETPKNPKKKLAIIGASTFQEPLIAKANEMGLETHVFAWQAGDVGESMASVFHPISIIEKEKIAEVCKAENIDGITTIGSDLANITVAYVANELGLTSNSIECVHASTDKHAMRKRFEEAGCPTPKSFAVENIEQVIDTELDFPIIIKPSDRSGSRGITKLDSPVGMDAALTRARESSFSGTVLAEEFVDGTEYSVEYISWQGKHHFLSITEKFTSGAPNFIETGHLEPARLKPGTEAKIREVVKDALDALDVQNGASHSEVKVNSKGDVMIIEIGSRMGGDRIGSSLVPLSTGYDFLKATIQVALGEEPETPTITERKPACVRFVFSEKDVSNLEALHENENCTINFISPVKHVEGDITDSSTRYGYYVFTAKNLSDMEPFLPSHEV